MANYPYTGVIVAWSLSPHGGQGRIFSQGELFFVCRKFVVKGEPVVGASVSFTPQPKREGTRYRQATECVVDNTRVIRGDERTPKPKPKVSAGNHPLAVLTGSGK